MASNWITSVILGHLNKNDISIKQIFVTPVMLSELIKMVDSGKISSKQAKEVLYKALMDDKEPSKIVEEEGMQQIGDEDSIKTIVLEVLEEQPNAIEQYKNGRTNIVDFLVGQVMKESKGRANPGMVNQLLQKFLND